MGIGQIGNSTYLVKCARFPLAANLSLVDTHVLCGRIYRDAAVSVQSSGQARRVRRWRMDTDRFPLCACHRRGDDVRRFVFVQGLLPRLDQLARPLCSRPVRTTQKGSTVLEEQREDSFCYYVSADSNGRRGRVLTLWIMSCLGSVRSSKASESNSSRKALASSCAL